MLVERNCNHNCPCMVRAPSDQIDSAGAVRDAGAVFAAICWLNRLCDVQSLWRCLTAWNQCQEPRKDLGAPMDRCSRIDIGVDKEIAAPNARRTDRRARDQPGGWWRSPRSVVETRRGIRDFFARTPRLNPPDRHDRDSHRRPRTANWTSPLYHTH